MADVYDFCKQKIKEDKYYYILDFHRNLIEDFLWNEIQNAKGEINKTGLAQYIHEDEKIYNKVFSIDYEMYKKHCVFACLVSDDFTKEDEEELKDYLNGQISDGWGENGIYILSPTENKLKDISLEDNVRRCWKIGEHSVNPTYIDDYNEYVKAYKERWGILGLGLEPEL